ncbi:Pyridoxal phosphate-dependent decarboxylase [Corchorus olitorius]|uniref:Pyridoxal phosphate-dependent decarboxylase n=1 Tax=Corchorus olitorius TaxID=93759 RepID=A0A1R3JBY4_9ROSI|nr:Pyridoxal phosphate-dependent decarboxylase [Corchorus olitorius]
MGSLSSMNIEPARKSFPNVVNINPLDPEEFRRQGHMIIDFLADYYQNIDKYPVLSQVEPGYLRKLLPMSAPNVGEPVEAILEDVQKHIIPGITHWQSPNYFAYFPSSGSVAGFLGEMLSSGFNVVGFNWISSPAATELESIVMDWLGKLLDLPQAFLFAGNCGGGGGGGVIQGTTCEAMLCTITAARDQMLTKIGRHNIEKLVVYGSDQTHCALAKAAKISGIAPQNIRAIRTKMETSFGLSPESLRSTIIKDINEGLIPLYLCATVGTTTTTAVDPVGPLCNVANEYGIWVHVDAAYAGSACICPEFRHFINGVEGANSFSLNAHKWLFTTLDCCCLWLKDPTSLIKSLSTNPEYLKNKASDSKQVVDYKDWQITLSRRFRAMKLWLVLRSYGAANLRNFLRNHVKMAKHFEELVCSDSRFEVVVPRYFAMVCFRVLPSAILKLSKTKLINHHYYYSINYENNEMDAIANEFNRKLLERINAAGEIYMSHGMVEGIYVIRFAIGASLTEEKHVIMAWKVVQHMVDTMLN